jgi:RNA-directed DNA polymerase
VAVSFDTIPHAALINRVKEKMADGRVLELLRAFLTQRVMETAEGGVPEEGTPQGAVVSPLLSNIYLDPLDPQMARQGYEMIRYADDCAPRAQRTEEGPMCVTA